MFKQKCPSCDRKIERKFNYCPYCGASIKMLKEKEDYGFLGKNDSVDLVRGPEKLPFGMEKIMGSLVKQLEKQMKEMNFENSGMPKGFKIRVSTGNPMKQIVKQNPVVEKVQPNIVEDEKRSKLPKIDADSKVRRLSDTIIYEIKTPGVKSKKDVVITELASGIEVRAYSKDKCYVKVIPLKFEIIKHYLEDDKLFLELKG